MATNPEIIDISMYDNGASKNIIWSREWDLHILNFDLGHARCVSNDISEITDVTDVRQGSTMDYAQWVEMGSSWCAAVGIVTELMDVETMLTGGQTSDLTSYIYYALANLKSENEKITSILNIRNF